MRKPSKQLKSRRVPPLPIVDVEALKVGLPIFWPVRHQIWNIPYTIRPADVHLAGVMNEHMGVGTVNFSNPALLELEAVWHTLLTARPDDGFAIFVRLWWLAEFLDDTLLDSISDLLVNASQTSESWEATLFAAATVAGMEDARMVDPVSFDAIIQQKICPGVK